MEQLSFRELQRRLKEVDPTIPVAGEGITKKVLQERWDKYQGQNKQIEAREPEETLVESMKMLSLKPKRKRVPTKGEIDLYNLLSPYLHMVPEMRPMGTVSLMRDREKGQNTMGLFEDELSVLTTLEDEETEEERIFIQRVLEESTELYRYIDQFSFVVDRFVEKYPVIFTTLLYAFRDRMEKIILSSTDKRIASLPVLHGMIKENRNHPLTPWLLRSFHYMEEMEVFSSRLDNKEQLSENDQIAISLLTGSTQSRLLYIVKNNLPYKLFAETMTTFLYIKDVNFDTRVKVIDALIDNIPYLNLWLDIAHLFVKYTGAKYIWRYFEYLLRIVVVNTIRLNQPSFTLALLDDSLFQYNLVPHTYQVSKIVEEGEKTLEWPSVIPRLITGRSDNSGDIMYYTIEPLAYIFSTLNLDVMERYWSIVSTNTAFIEDLFSPFVENIFWYGVRPFVMEHGRSFPSELVETIRYLVDNPHIFYIPNIVGLLYEIVDQDSYKGKGWQQVFASLLPIVSDEAISILLTMVVRNPKVPYTDEEGRLRMIGYAWLTSKLREIKKTKYFIDAIREEAAKRNVVESDHLAVLNAEDVRF